MKESLRETLYQSLKISVYVFTLILLMFGCFYIRDEHWFDRPEPQKILRTVDVDRNREILVRAEQDGEINDPWELYFSLYEQYMEDGNVPPVGEMFDAFLDSDIADSLFTEEELEELRKTSQAGWQLFMQLVEEQKEKEEE